MAALIENRVYRGEARYGKWKNPAAHDEIVSEREWQSAQRKAAGVQCTRVAPLSLLRGLAFCASCGGKLSPLKGGTKGSPRYACRRNQQVSGTCDAPVSCSQAELDGLVSRAFLQVVPQFYAAGRPPVDVEPLDRALGKAQDDLDALLEAVGKADAATVGLLVGAVAEKRGAVEAAQASLESAALGTGLAREAGTIGMRWEAMGNDERNRWLREWGVRVEVERRRLDGDGRIVPLEWRTEFTWSPEPLHPETVRLAGLKDLWESVEAEKAA
jgi:Recombinase zinc beta ribbon domain